MVKQLVPSALRPAARRALTRAKVAVGPSRGRGLSLRAEARFWRGWFDLPGANLDERLDPAIIDKTVLACIARLPAAEVSIIDVGAGPLSTLGTQAPAKRVRLTAVDPLADRYDTLLRERGITPLVRTQSCAGERLLELFDPETFDLAFAENSLDHAAEPLRIIHNMVTLVGPGGFVVLNHGPDEAEGSGYRQLHQWNFRERDGRCILWRPGTEYDLAAEFPGVSVACEVEHRRDGRRVICVMRKRESVPSA
jgi:SAM-dependent methyltransferase